MPLSDRIIPNAQPSEFLLCVNTSVAFNSCLATIKLHKIQYVASVHLTFITRCLVHLPENLEFTTNAHAKHNFLHDANRQLG